MSREVCTSVLTPERGVGSDEMRTPEDVLEMRRLQGLGWGTRRIAAQLGCSRTTVQVWLRRGRWRKPARRRRDGVLRGLEGWLRDRLVQHEGNADVVRQELEALGVRVSLRTVQRAVEPFRRELRAAVVATTRFETPPGVSVADRFRPAAGVDRRGEEEGGAVRGDARVFASDACSGVRGGNGRRTGSRVWRARSRSSGAFPRRCCWTTPGHW